MHPAQKTGRTFILLVYSGCIMSSSLVNLSHYLHHLLAHTLHEHEHVEQFNNRETGTHGHNHNDLLDRFLQKIETDDPAGHDHDMLTVVLMEHINTGHVPTGDHLAATSEYTAAIRPLNTLFTPKPLSPPPKGQNDPATF